MSLRSMAVAPFLDRPCSFIKWDPTAGSSSSCLCISRTNRESQISTISTPISLQYNG